jgi:WD40 repeat protein
VSINAEGTRVTTGGSDFTVRFWDATSGDLLQTLPQEHVAKVANMHGSSKLLVAGNMPHIRLYDLNKIEAAAQQSKGELGRQHRGVFSPNGEMAITAGHEKAMQLWDLRTMEAGARVELPSPVVDLEAVSGMLTVAMTDKVHVYDLAGAAPALRHEIEVPEGSVTAASLNPHFGLPGLAQVLTAERNVPGVGAVCRLWDLNGKLLDTLKGHEKPVLAVRFAPTGTSAASGSEDCTLRIWPLKERAAQRAGTS